MIHAILIEIFGEYIPLSQTVLRTYTSADGTISTTEIQEVISGIAGVNFEWIAGVLLFALCLYSLFRLLGVLLK